MTVQLAERVVDLDGVRVRYRVTGAGEPVVLVHGLSGSTRWWTPVLPALAEERAVYLVDLPGFGTMRGRRFVLADASSWLARWLEGVGLGRASVVGHSLGAAVALRLAAVHGERIERLVLVAPAGLAIGRSLAGNAASLLVALRRASPRFLSVLATDALRAGPRTLLRATREILGEDVRDALAEVSAPALVIAGETDTLVPLAAAELVASTIPGARLVVLEGAGHVPMFDRPDAFAGVVTEFLSPHASSARNARTRRARSRGRE